MRTHRVLCTLTALGAACAAACGCESATPQAQWQQRAVFDHDGAAVAHICFSPDGERLALGRRFISPPDERPLILQRPPDALDFLNSETGARDFDTYLETDSLKGVSFSAAGDSILVVALDEPSQVLRFDAITGEPQGELPRPADGEFGAAVSADGQRIAWRCKGGLIRVWDGAGEEQAAIDAGDTMHGGTLVFSPDGRRLAACYGHGLHDSAEKKVVVWDVATGREVSTIACADFVFAVFSPDGRVLATPYEGAVTLWDVTTGKLLHTIDPGYDDLVVTFSPDGRTLITSGSKWKESLYPKLPFANKRNGRREVKFFVWDVDSGALRTIIPDSGATESRARVCSLAFSPDGRTLAVGHYYGRLRLWDVPAEALR